MFNPRLSLLAGAACALAALSLAPRARADSLIWSTSGYTYNSSQLTTPGTVGTTAGGNTVRIQYGFQNLPTGITSYFNNSSAAQPSPAVGTYSGSTTTYTDGGTTAANGTASSALQIIANFDNAGALIANAGISVTVFFSKPVSGLMFSFWDVDNGTVANNGPYNDFISNISAITVASPGNPATTIRPTSLAPGGTNTSANGTTSGSFTGSANNAQTSAGGNAMVNFGTNQITQFTFTYGDSLAAGSAHSNLQIIALSDLTFTTVPEPSTWACFAVAGVAGVWTLRRRVRRTA